MFLVRFFFSLKILWFFFWFDKFLLPKTNFSNKRTFLEQSFVFFFLFILVFILIIYLLIFIDKRSTLSGYVASVSPIKLSKSKKSHNNQMKPPKQYFDFYFHGQDEVRRGVCFSPQKHKILDEILKSQHDQECIIKKVKLNEKKYRFRINWFYHYYKTRIGWR